MDNATVNRCNSIDIAALETFAGTQEGGWVGGAARASGGEGGTGDGERGLQV